jgi:hypothetical protein
MARASKPKFKTGRRKGWTTLEQYDWLRGQLPTYLTLKAESQRRLNMFWIQLFDGWFQCWPVVSTSQEEYTNKMEVQKIVCIVIYSGPKLIGCPL